MLSSRALFLAPPLPPRELDVWHVSDAVPGTLGQHSLDGRSCHLRSSNASSAPGNALGQTTVVAQATVVSVPPFQWNQSSDFGRGQNGPGLECPGGDEKSKPGTEPRGWGGRGLGSVRGGGVVSNSQSDMLIHQVGNSAQRLIRPLFIV